MDTRNLSLSLRDGNDGESSRNTRNTSVSGTMNGQFKVVYYICMLMMLYLTNPDTVSIHGPKIFTATINFFIGIPLFRICTMLRGLSLRLTQHGRLTRRFSMPVLRSLTDNLVPSIDATFPGHHEGTIWGITYLICYVCKARKPVVPCLELLLSNDYVYYALTLHFIVTVLQSLRCVFCYPEMAMVDPPNHIYAPHIIDVHSATRALPQLDGASDDQPHFTTADLHTDRYNENVAAWDEQRDHVWRLGFLPTLQTPAPAKGTEAACAAWKNFSATTDQKDVDAITKGDLHGGQLHRMNRTARLPPPTPRPAPPSSAPCTPTPPAPAAARAPVTWNRGMLVTPEIFLEGARIKKGGLGASKWSSS